MNKYCECEGVKETVGYYKTADNKEVCKYCRKPIKEFMKVKSKPNFDDRLVSMVIVPDMGGGFRWADGQIRLSQQSIKNIKAEIAAVMPKKKKSSIAHKDFGMTEWERGVIDGTNTTLQEVSEALGITNENT